MIIKNILNIISKFSSYCKKNQKTIARWFFATNHKDVGSLYIFLLILTMFRVFLVLIITIILKINSFFVLYFFFKNIYNFDLIFYIILLDFLIVYFIFIYFFNFFKNSKKNYTYEFKFICATLGFGSTNSTLGYISNRIIKNQIGDNYVTSNAGNYFERCDFFRASWNLPAHIARVPLPPQLLQKQINRTILKPEYQNYKYRSSLYDTLLCDLNSGELLMRSETKSCKFSFSSSNSFTSKHSTSLLNRFNSKYYHNPRVKINEINLLCPSKRGTWVL